MGLAWRCITVYILMVRFHFTIFPGAGSHEHKKLSNGFRFGGASNGNMCMVLGCRFGVFLLGGSFAHGLDWVSGSLVCLSERLSERASERSIRFEYR